MKIFTRIWQEIRHGENIDLYLTIGAALVLAALSLAGWNAADKIAGVTLAVLALLAISNLVNRYKLEGLASSNLVNRQKIDDLASSHLVNMQELEEILQNHFGTSFFMKSYPKDILRKDFEQAEEIWLIGRDLGRITEGERLLFENYLQKGGKINVLVVNPDDLHAIEYLHKASPDHDDVKDIQTEIRQTIKKWQRLAKGHETMVEFRVIDQPLTFGANAVNLNSERGGGKIYLDLYAYRAKLDGRVKFTLSPTDTIWYDIYRQQIFALWNDGKPYSFDGLGG